MTKVSSEAVFDGALLHVRRDTVRLPDGSEATREYIVHPGAVMIVPMLADGRCCRAPVPVSARQVFIEFPAGKIDSGEDPLATAKRELVEETGFAAAQWTYLTTLHPVIGYSNERILIYLADELSHVGVKLDAGEFVQTFSATLEEALQFVDRGEVSDGKTMIGILLLARRLAGSNATGLERP